MKHDLGRIIAVLMSVAGITTACQAQQSATADKPNILLLYVDNAGYGDLGCYGNRVVKTPRIDRLASEGARCADFYVSASSCTPSRGAILTGRHPLRNGLAHQLARTENWIGIGLPHRERIIPHYLKQAGYATACFGKWNIGFAPGSRPTERGFDEFFGFRSGNINYYTHIYNGEYDMFRGTERHKVEGYSTDLFADAACDFIRRQDKKPWFVYLPFNAAHYVSGVNMAPGEKPEWQVPGKYLERYGWPANDPDEKHRYLAVLTALDDAIGRVLDTLDGLKLRERTLVILISDNGAFMLPKCGLEVASNAPLRDGGTTCYEGGVRVPAMFRWPGKIKPGTVCREMLSHLDVLPLCLTAAGLPLPKDRVLDGRNPLPALTGKAKSPHSSLAFAYGTGSGLRQGNLKLIRPKPNAPWELYDLAADPGERENLAEKRPADLTRLTSEFEKWLTEVKTDASEPAPRPATEKSAKKVVMLGATPAASYYRPVKAQKRAVRECEVAVYGGTPAGVAAAIQAARTGRKTLLLSFNQHVGGMTSGGLTATDIGKKESVGGLALDFYTRIGRIVGFSPSAAESLYLTMLQEAGVTVLLGRCLESVEMRDNRLVSIAMETGETIKAAMFIDATYEGDLMAAAGVSYRVGREPRSAFNESLAGQWQQISWKDVYQFCRLPISPYLVAGDPASGLLPEISPEKPGAPGQGDYRVQAYNFRMYLSNQAGRIPFPKPEGYHPARYGLLARFLNADPGIQWTLHYTVRPMTDGPVQMRHGDSNNAGSFSSDYVGGCHRWPDGTYEAVSFSELPAPRRGLTMPFRKLYELRERIFQDHVSYQQGLLYFLANDPQVPQELQERVRKFGLDPDEFKETGHWPHQLYVREGRRMVSGYVMTQENCESKRTVDDPVGLASYAMDSHFCQRVVVEENGKTTVRNEGGFGLGFRKPYPVAYRAIVPKKDECANLLVPVCLSASHVAYGSIRMEPVFMILGQSAGTAASLAIEDGVSVQDVDYGKLKHRLLAGKQRL
ncbi:MAG: FAD-dependent oxidoreductase [Verrucomicrobia bacterium]|nr:FAD-dependent oxidoreductase [Verrucomicrobiota bacterium]